MARSVALVRFGALAWALWGTSLVASALSASGCSSAHSAEVVDEHSYAQDIAPEALHRTALRWYLGVGLGDKLRQGKLELYYQNPVTEAEAQALGQYLSRLGLSDRATIAQVARRYSTEPAPAGYELRISTAFSRSKDIGEETRSVFQLLALGAEGAAFAGSPVDVVLCDPMLKPLLRLRPRVERTAAQ